MSLQDLIEDTLNAYGVLNAKTIAEDLRSKVMDYISSIVKIQLTEKESRLLNDQSD
jgi:hypothetical protein